MTDVDRAREHLEGLLAQMEPSVAAALRASIVDCCDLPDPGAAARRALADITSYLTSEVTQ